MLRCTVMQDGNCDGETRTECFRCGNPVCKSCSKVQEYLQFGRKRICADCNEEIKKDTQRIKEIRKKEMSDLKKSIKSCLAYAKANRFRHTERFLKAAFEVVDFEESKSLDMYFKMKFHDNGFVIIRGKKTKVDGATNEASCSTARNVSGTED